MHSSYSLFPQSEEATISNDELCVACLHIVWHFSGPCIRTPCEERLYASGRYGLLMLLAWVCLVAMTLLCALTTAGLHRAELESFCFPVWAQCRYSLWDGLWRHEPEIHQQCWTLSLFWKPAHEWLTHVSCTVILFEMESPKRLWKLHEGTPKESGSHLWMRCKCILNH